MKSFFGERRPAAEADGFWMFLAVAGVQRATGKRICATNSVYT